MIDRRLTFLKKRDYRMITAQAFGKIDQDRIITLYRLKNTHHIEIEILTYGGIVHSIKTPDRNGQIGEITIGYDTLEQYRNHNQYFGALIGRYANRIKDAGFVLDNKEYRISKNHGNHHLHGGTSGFDQKIWNAGIINKNGLECLELRYHSLDGEEGFPGNLDTQVIYSLTDRDELIIDYRAVTDKKTHVNLTSHIYFNLTGDSQKSILDHELTINAAAFTEIDQDCIPTGKMIKVEDTPFDFRQPCAIGKRIGHDHNQLIFGRGYDHNYVLNADGRPDIPAAGVYDPFSGRRMELFATQPGLQFYSGNTLDEKQAGKNKAPIHVRHGFCLEAQHFPDSPNRAGFPSTLLGPGKCYSHQLILKFSA